MLSAWSVLWAAFALVASAAPNYSQYGSYGQPQKTTIAPVADASVGFDCSNLEDGAHGEGCSNIYFLCWKGVATSQECPSDMMFNIENAQCELFENVFACSGVRPTTVAPIESDNVPMPEVDFDCSHLEDGDYSFSQKSCQVNYVSCVAGAAWERTCPEGLSFDLEERVCKLLENIIACGGSAPTEAPVLVINFDCPSPSGSFALLSQLCSATYYICEDNVASIAVCDEPMIWDDSSKLCKLPKNIPECSFDCSGKADSSFSEGCSQNYWWCWQEKATKLACPDSMVFDGDRAMCDFKENVIECGGALPTTLAPIVSDNATPMPVDFDCSIVEDGQHAFKNGELCQPKFVSCVGGVAWEMACPDGLMFDPEQMLCERIESIIACGGTPEPITTTYSYETTRAAEPTTKKASYGSYQAPTVKPVKKTLKQHKQLTTRKAMKTTTLAADNYYQTTTLAAEPITLRSYNAYQTTLAAEPTTRLRKVHKTTIKALKTTTPLAEDTTTVDYGYELGSAPEILSVYGSYETPAAEPTTRRHIKTTLAAEPTTRKSYGSYQTTTPLAEPTTRKSYGSYQAPIAEPTTRRHIKTTRRAALTTRAAYGYQTTTPAAEPTTKSYGYQAPAAEPTTRRHIKTTTLADDSYGSYQTTTPLAEPTTRKSYGSYQAPIAEPTTRRHIKTTRRAVLTTRAAYGGYQTTTPAAEPITRPSAYGSKKLIASPTLKPIKKEQQGY